MATIKLTIIPAKVLGDRTHKIRVAIHHKDETKYIITRFKIDGLSQFKNGQVVKRPDASVINTKLRNILNEYQEKLDSIKSVSMYSCQQLREILISNTSLDKATTFQAVANSYVTELIEDGRGNYAKLLERNCRYFVEFTKGDFLLSEITPQIITNYSRFLRNKKGVGDTTIGMMMSRTRTIINRAVKTQLVKYDIHPFANYSITSAPVRELDLTLDSFNKLRNATPKERKYKVAHDIFCLSFYLGGINLVDLMEIDFRNRYKIEYVRTKSRNTTRNANSIVLPIPEPAYELIKVWMNQNTGKLDFGYNFSYSNFSRYVSRSLVSFAKSLGIKEKVVYYSARKTFAQFASELGIPDGVIDYCLGHSDKSKGVIRFYTKVRQKQAEIAIIRVIDYTENPEKYKEFLEMRGDVMMMKG